MTAIAIAADEIAAHNKALVANTQDTVTFTGRRVHRVGILVFDALAPVYVTIDGTAATVAGAKTYVIPAGGALELLATADNPTVVKLISADVAHYSVVHQNESWRLGVVTIPA